MSKSDKSTTSLPFRNFFINSYILPGFLFLLAIIISCFAFREELHSWTLFQGDGFKEFIKSGKITDYLNKDTAFSIELLLIAIILFTSLILGNAISVIGGFLFDTLWMEKGVGWPYERILSFYPKKYARRAFHLLMFLTINLASLFFILDYISGKTLSYVAYGILIFYFIIRELWIKWVTYPVYGKDKVFKAFFKSRVGKRNRTRMNELMFVFFKILYSNSKFNFTKYKYLNAIFKFLIYIVTLGIFLDVAVFPAIVLGKFFGLTKALARNKRKVFRDKFKDTFSPEGLKNDTEIYWNSYIYLSNNNLENTRIANSHLKRSILLRNLAATGVIMLFILLKLKPELDTDNYYRWQYWCIIWYIASYLLFIGYNHVIYKYYTKFLLRCFILEKETNVNNNAQVVIKQN